MFSTEWRHPEHSEGLFKTLLEMEGLISERGFIERGEKSSFYGALVSSFSKSTVHCDREAFNVHFILFSHV